MSLTNFTNSHRFFEDEWSMFDPDASALIHCNSGIVNRSNKANAIAPLLTSDLIESETDFHIYADLPGVDIKDLDVAIEGKQLVINAERKHVHQTGNDKVHSMERSFGKAMRSIRIPNNVDIENVDVNFHNGVLAVSFPKLQPGESTSKKLKITNNQYTSL